MTQLSIVRVALFSVTLGCVTLAGCASTTSGGDIASVNGQGIPRSDFNNQLETTPAAKQILNQLIQGSLIDQYAKSNNIVVSDAELAAKRNELAARYQPGQFDAMLKAQNISPEQLNKILRQNIIIEKAVAPQISITDADIANYLKANHATLDTPDQVRARHILVKDLATANTVEVKLKGGMKFEDAAKQYSQDPGSKDKGGELGTFGRQAMVAPFAVAAFSQPVGVIGPPVKSPFGFHIIQVEEKKPKQVATLANSRDKIKTTLQQQQESTKVPVFMNDLRNKAKIEVADDKLKDVLATPPPVGPGGPPPGAR